MTLACLDHRVSSTLVPALFGWKIRIANSQTTTGSYVQTERLNIAVSVLLAPLTFLPPLLSQFGLGAFRLLICNLVHAVLNDPADTGGVYLPCDTDHGWKFRYSAACLAPTVKFCSSLKTPGYSQFLELDRRIRTFPLPNHLQSPLDESPEGWADDPSLAMQQYGVVCERESSE